MMIDRAMLCSFRIRLGEFDSRLSSNCTNVVTITGASPQFSSAASNAARLACETVRTSGSVTL
jgi:hypothetical protein